MLTTLEDQTASWGPLYVVLWLSLANCLSPWHLTCYWSTEPQTKGHTEAWGNLSTGKQGDCDFGAILGYLVSWRPDWPTQWGPDSNKTKRNKTKSWGCSPVVEHLPCLDKTLGSTPESFHSKKLKPEEMGEGGYARSWRIGAENQPVEMGLNCSIVSLS